MFLFILICLIEYFLIVCFLLIKFSRLNYMFGNKKKVVKTKPKPRAKSKLLNKRKLK